MRFFILCCLVALATADQRPQRRRGGRQLDTGYGAPAGYGAPEEPIFDVRSEEVLPSYEEEPLESYEGAESREAESTDAGLDMLMKAVPGVPGEDYPIYSEAPETEFSCEGQVNGGYYADTSAECQVFHICSDDGAGGLAKYSFLCPNGTIFNQAYFICDWWFNVDCSEAEALAEARNAEIASERDALSAEASAPAGYGAPAEEIIEDRAAEENYGAPREAEAPLDSYLGSYESDAAYDY